MLIVTIIIVILVAILLIYRNKENNMIEEQKDKLITLLTEKIGKIENRDQFFNIDSHIKKYFDYKKQNNLEAIKAISGEAIINNDNFQSREMYLLNRITDYTVYVYGKENKQNTYIDAYIVINLDYRNYTFEIRNSSKEEFENAKNNMVQQQYKENVNIQNHGYNEIILGEKANDFHVLKEYFDDYKFKAINYPEEAFALLDTTYKKEKFHNNLEQYKTYIQNNLEILQDANIVKHGVRQEGQTIKYTFVDNYDQYYEIRETGIYEYTITLDNHTVLSTEQQKKYEGLTDEQKATSNVEKVMKLLNQKDYETVYGYLNAEFKNKNFPTIEIFTNYMKENFFENNIVGNMKVKSEGNIYLITVPYKESLSTAAEEDEKTFIVKLGEGMNFELSFEI